MGPAEDVLTGPLHTYTRALLDVVPEAGGIDRPILQGEPPDPTRIPPGCRFHLTMPGGRLGRRGGGGWRPPAGQDLGLVELRRGHLAACHLAASRARSTA